jgi:hypothetical protein
MKDIWYMKYRNFYRNRQEKGSLSGYDSLCKIRKEYIKKEKSGQTGQRLLKNLGKGILKIGSIFL